MSISTLGQYYIPRLVNGKVEIASFGDDKRCVEDKAPEGVYTLRVYNGRWNCDCFGFKRQKDPAEHKHCKIANFWVENLKSQHGFVLWFEDDDICSHRFIDVLD